MKILPNFKEASYPILEFRHSYPHVNFVWNAAYMRFQMFGSWNLKLGIILLNLRIHHLINSHLWKITLYMVLLALPTFQCSNFTLCSYLRIALCKYKFCCAVYSKTLKEKAFAFRLQNNYLQNGSMLVDLQFTLRKVTLTCCN